MTTTIKHGLTIFSLIACLCVLGLGQGGNGFARLDTSINSGSIDTAKKEAHDGDDFRLEIHSLTGLGFGPIIGASLIPCLQEDPSWALGGIPGIIGLDLPTNLVAIADFSSLFPFAITSIAIEGVIPIGFMGSDRDLLLQTFLPDPAAPPFNVAVTNTVRWTASSQADFYDEVDDYVCSLRSMSDDDLGTEVHFETADHTNAHEVTGGQDGTGTTSSFSIAEPAMGTRGPGAEGIARFTCTNPLGGRYRISSEGSDFDTVLYITDDATTPIVFNDDASMATTTSILDIDLVFGERILIFLDGKAGNTGTGRLKVTRPIIVDSFTEPAALSCSGGQTFSVIGHNLDTISSAKFLRGETQTATVSGTPTNLRFTSPAFASFTTTADVTVELVSTIAGNFTLTTLDNPRLRTKYNQNTNITHPLRTAIRYRDTLYTTTWIAPTRGLVSFSALGAPLPFPLAPADVLSVGGTTVPRIAVAFSDYYGPFDPLIPGAAPVEVLVDEDACDQSLRITWRNIHWAPAVIIFSGPVAGEFSCQLDQSGDVAFDHSAFIPLGVGLPPTPEVFVGLSGSATSLTDISTVPAALGFAQQIAGAATSETVGETFLQTDSFPLGTWRAEWQSATSEWLFF